MGLACPDSTGTGRARAPVAVAVAGPATPEHVRQTQPLFCCCCCCVRHLVRVRCHSSAVHEAPAGRLRGERCTALLHAMVLLARTQHGAVSQSHAIQRGRRYFGHVVKYAAGISDAV